MRPRKSKRKMILKLSKKVTLILGEIDSIEQILTADDFSNSLIGVTDSEVIDTKSRGQIGARKGDLQKKVRPDSVTLSFGQL